MEAQSITTILYLTSNNNTLTGNIPVTSNITYLINWKVLKCDLGSSSERLVSLKLDGKELGECNPPGGDYDCTFYGGNDNSCVTSAVKCLPLANIVQVISFIVFDLATRGHATS